MENWLTQQITAMTENWGCAIEKYYPHALPVWTDPDKNVALMKEVYLNPYYKIDWGGTIKVPDAKVLDLGCGSGWLSALLSKNTAVGSIDALDSDKRNLENLFPVVVEKFNGDLSKINIITGIFEPICRPDGYYDLIVASASVHHSPNLFSLFRELCRVLAPDGRLVVMNEVPLTQEEYLNYIMTIAYLTFKRSLESNSFEGAESLSGQGILYDAKLGDYAFSRYHYHQAITTAGLDYETIETGCKGGRSTFVHFICRHAPEKWTVPNLEERAPSETLTVEPITIARYQQLIGITGEGADFYFQVKCWSDLYRDSQQEVASLTGKLNELCKTPIRTILRYFYRRLRSRLGRLRARE